MIDPRTRRPYATISVAADCYDEFLELVIKRHLIHCTETKWKKPLMKLQTFAYDAEQEAIQNYIEDYALTDEEQELYERAVAESEAYRRRKFDR